ncbi:MAG: hypothetical protein ACTS5A_02995 [Candidatus Hodgkinia cicadicola]
MKDKFVNHDVHFVNCRNEHEAMWLTFRGYALNLPSSFSANDPKRLSMFN